jgi:hypothetical protein
MSSYDEDEEDQAPMDTEARWIAIVFFLLLLGLFTAEIVVNFHPAKLTALFIILFWIPLLALHETGHAVMAALLGWRVHRVVIGMGRCLWSFRVGGTPVEIRMLPVEGFVQGSPTSLRAVRLKSALFALAGPAATLLPLGVLALVPGVDTLLTRTDDIGLLAAQSLAVAILVSVVINLIPHYAPPQPGEPAEAWKASDGMNIILSFVRPKEAYGRQPETAEPWSEDPDRWKH